MSEGDRKDHDSPIPSDPRQDLQVLDLHFKSHVYSALGAVLHQQRDMVIWTELDLEELKRDPRVTKKSTARSYYSKQTKDRQYSFLSLACEEGEVMLGLTRSFQSRRLEEHHQNPQVRKWLGDRGLKFLRLKLAPEDPGDRLCLVISHVAVIEPERIAVIEDWLEMDQDERY